MSQSSTPLPPLRFLGNQSLMRRRKTAFVCSRQVPWASEQKIRAWAENLTPQTDCILCGNHSRMERMVFDMLLARHIPTILVLAETFTPYWSPAIEAALSENRLLIVTHCDDTVHRVSQQSAADRNRVLLALADGDIVVGHCTPGGNIARQIQSMPQVILLDIPQPSRPVSWLQRMSAALGSWWRHWSATKATRSHRGRP